MASLAFSASLQARIISFLCGSNLAPGKINFVRCFARAVILIASPGAGMKIGLPGSIAVRSHIIYYYMQQQAASLTEL